MQLSDLTPEQLSEVEALLPDSFHEVASVIGNASALNLVDALGGISIICPVGKNGDSKYLGLLLDAIGEAATRQFCAVYRGASFYIPACTKALQHIKKLRFLDDVNALMARGHSKTTAIELAGKKIGISPRQGWAYLAVRYEQ